MSLPKWTEMNSSKQKPDSVSYVAFLWLVFQKKKLTHMVWSLDRDIIKEGITFYYLYSLYTFIIFILRLFSAQSWPHKSHPPL